LDPLSAVVLLTSIYCAGTYGGAITAILINTPGTPAAAATCLDGYPLAQKGEAGRALGMATVSSVVGGIFSVIVLVFFAPFLAKLAYEFGQPEYFALAIFGLTMLASIGEGTPIKNENTAFHPASPYAIAKVQAYWMTSLYREAYDMYTVNGILFNHESPFRGIDYVTRKISNGVAKISLGLEKDLKLGNIYAERDWGYAPEYMEGILLMMQQKKPEDFILATGKTHSIKEFVDEACKIVDISNTKIKTDKANFRPIDIPKLKGDYSKAKKKLKWKPKTTFKKLVKIMVEEDVKRWQKFLKKESQPWDLYHHK